MKDIVSAVEKIKKLKYQYLYDRYPYHDAYFYKIVSEILLADLKNLSVFQGNGLQFIFLLIEKAIFYNDLIWEESVRETEEYIKIESIMPDNLSALSMYYQYKRSDINAIDFFIKKILELNDEQSRQFVCDIELIMNFKGDIEILSNNIYKILTSKDNDYDKSFNLMKTMKLVANH